MPASSSSLVVSTSVYLLSSAIFLGIAYAPIQSSFRGAEGVAVGAVADSLKLQLDSLSSGGVTTISWKQSGFQVPVSVSIGGHSITVSLRGVVEIRQVRWTLPDMVLHPGEIYVASAQGDRVRIDETQKRVG